MKSSGFNSYSWCSGRRPFRLAYFWARSWAGCVWEAWVSRMSLRRLEREDHLLVLKALDEVNLGSALHLLKTYAGRVSDLQTWVNGAEINRDINLRLQYLAGMRLNSYESEFIYDTLLAFRRYPYDLFGEGIQLKNVKADGKQQEGWQGRKRKIRQNIGGLKPVFGETAWANV